MTKTEIRISKQELEAGKSKLNYLGLTKMTLPLLVQFSYQDVCEALEGITDGEEITTEIDIKHENQELIIKVIQVSASTYETNPNIIRSYRGFF